MQVQLRLSTSLDARIIKNLWTLYQHDVSAFDGSTPNRHGLFGVEDSVMTLGPHSETLSAWWEDPNALFPYQILADGNPAGFTLIAAKSRLPSAIAADFVVHEFFLLHAYRGKGVGESAVVAGFDLHRGTWEVVTYPNHARGIAFWRRVIGDYSASGFSECEMDHPGEEGWSSRSATPSPTPRVATAPATDRPRNEAGAAETARGIRL